jgi:hypothetical protein
LGEAHGARRQNRNLALSPRRVAAKTPMRRAMTDDPLDDIRDAIRAIMQLSFAKLLQRGYSRDSAKALLLRMTRGIAGHIDDQQT